MFVTGQTRLLFGDDIGIDTQLLFGNATNAQTVLAFGDRYVDHGVAVLFGNTPIETDALIRVGSDVCRQELLPIRYLCPIEAAASIRIGFAVMVERQEQLPFSILDKNPIAKQERLIYSLLPPTNPISPESTVRAWVGGELL
ncbi:MAG: hypothetical protein HQL56_09775 [Magnetococcales bacterium]|nr:hypothetical protein [Magnetococcales bacterium]